MFLLSRALGIMRFRALRVLLTSRYIESFMARAVRGLSERERFLRESERERERNPYSITLAKEREREIERESYSITLAKERERERGERE